MNHELPNADRPQEVGESLASLDEVNHVTAEVEFTHRGATYDIDAWVDPDAGAYIGAKMCQILENAGYPILEVTNSGDSGNVWIRADIETDDEDDE